MDEGENARNPAVGPSAPWRFRLEKLAFVVGGLVVGALLLWLAYVLGSEWLGQAPADRLAEHHASREVRRFQAAAAVLCAAATMVFGLPPGQAHQTILRAFDYLVLAFVAGAGVLALVVAWLEWRLDYPTWLAQRRQREADKRVPQPARKRVPRASLLTALVLGSVLLLIVAWNVLFR